MGELIQFRPRHPARQVNAAADRAFWMGHPRGDGTGTMLTGPSVRSTNVTATIQDAQAIPQRDKIAGKITPIGAETDWYMAWPDSGDCA